MCDTHNSSMGVKIIKTPENYQYAQTALNYKFSHLTLSNQAHFWLENVKFLSQALLPRKALSQV